MLRERLQSRVLGCTGITKAHVIRSQLLQSCPYVAEQPSNARPARRAHSALHREPSYIPIYASATTGIGLGRLRG
jgi:hypothetical protein